MKNNNFTGKVKKSIELKLAYFGKELFGIPPREEIITLILKDPTQEKQLSHDDMKRKVERARLGNFVFDPFENYLPTKDNDNSMNF